MSLQSRREFVADELDETQFFRRRLVGALESIDRPSEVCTAGDRPLVMPGLQVEGLGSLGLPLGKAQASELIKLCRQAPYGKGTETLVDKKVRRVWELDPSKFKLTNPEWDKLIASIIDDVKKDLGLEDRELSAHLYKLLVYEKGSFFLPHRDGEKLDRMVATLVVALPSVHEGGELVVSHDDVEHEISFKGAASGLKLSYAAFYADCEHDVRPLTRGHRLCLTYNVTLAKSRGKKGIAAPSYVEATAAIGELVGTFWERSNLKKIAVTLDHRYTKDGLKLDRLKGVDRARADVLFEAAKSADCHAYLGLVTLYQMGSAEGEDMGRRHSSWREKRYQASQGEHHMGEIYEDSFSIDHWSDRAGRKVDLGEITVEDDEIISGQALLDGPPSEEDFEGFTGNAGMTLERWYRRAAIVIWPRQHHYAVLSAAGTTASIVSLKPMVEKLGKAKGVRRERLLADCLDFAAFIISSWDATSGSRRRTQSDTIRGSFLPILQELDDPSLVKRFLSLVVQHDNELQVDASFAKFCGRHGWGLFETELHDIINLVNADNVVRNAEFLVTLCLARDKNEDRLQLCNNLAQLAVESLRSFDEDPQQKAWQRFGIKRSQLLRSLAQALLAVEAKKPLAALIKHSFARTEDYDLIDTHLPAIFALEKWLAKHPISNVTIKSWLCRCRETLEKRTATAPQEPTDFRRPSELSCHCADCLKLSEYLSDPAQSEARFSVNERRRDHLEGTIGSSRSDCSYETERRGSPHTLVCTKNTASYDRSCKTYEQDTASLERIIRIEV